MYHLWAESGPFLAGRDQIGLKRVHCVYSSFLIQKSRFYCKVSRFEYKVSRFYYNFSRFESKSSHRYVAYHAETRDLHLECIAIETSLQDEITVAEESSTLQLAVMWVNKWSDDFETGYLATLSNDERVREDEFKDVDWIRVFLHHFYIILT